MLDSVLIVVDDEPINVGEALRIARGYGFADVLARVTRHVRILQQAARRGLSVSEAELQAEADALRVERGLEDAASTHAWLEHHGLEVDDLEELARVRALERQLASQAISDREIEDHFARAPERYGAVAISRILVPYEGIAWEIYLAIVDDAEDFAVLARRYSDGEALRVSGGSLGLLPFDRLGPQSSAIRAAPAGTVLRPFAAEDGWEVIRVDGHRSARLDDLTRAEIRTELFDAWLAQRASEVP